MVVQPFLRYLQTQFKGQGAAKVYFIGGDYVYPRSTNAYARKVAEDLGWVVVGEEYSDTGTTDYTPVIRRILAATRSRSRRTRSIRDGQISVSRTSGRSSLRGFDCAVDLGGSLGTKAAGRAVLDRV